MSERPLADTTHLFIGKTIKSMDASCCNNVQFNFTDGTSVVLHIEMDGLGLPEVATCTQCAEPVEA